MCEFMLPKSIAIALGVLLQYVALVVVLTWPLAQYASTHLPGRLCSFDNLLVTWALAHESRALVSDPCALPHAGIYHPTPYALFYGETAFGALPYFLPAFLLTNNPTLAMNVTFLLCVTLTA